ncbi:MAG: DUF3124 domain-containing protein [Fluviicola sp.]
MGKRTTYLGILVLLLFTNCTEDKELSSIDPVNWNKRTTHLNQADSLIHGQTYLSVYSQIYSQTEHSRHDLTATVSMRNMNTSDTIYISKAQYFDTKGKLIRTYFEKTIFIAPMETVEIVIDEDDRKGGTGANFLFDWQIEAGVIEPYFEGVMISTTGQQGLSFTTQGKRIGLAD